MIHSHDNPAAQDQTAPDIPRPDSLSLLLSAQLVVCINALEVGEGDNTIRKFGTSVSSEVSSPQFPAAAHSGGAEVWQAVMDLIKNLSEAILAALPNFWRIASSFMDGKLKKVNFIMRDLSSACPN